MSLKTCRRMLMAQTVGTAVYVKGQTLAEMSDPAATKARRRRRNTRARSHETSLLFSVDLSTSEAAVEPSQPARVRVSQKSNRSLLNTQTRFLEPVPGVGEYEISKYSDFTLREPRKRASPPVITTPDEPTHNTTPVGAYDIPPPPKITKNWSFGKVGKAQSSPHAGRPVPMEIIFRSSGALRLSTVRDNPGPDTYTSEVAKDTRMGTFTMEKRDKEKKLKEPPIGPGDYMKDNNFIKTDRAALLNVVGRVEPSLPFRRKEGNKAACERLVKAETKFMETKSTWNATASSWSTSPRRGIFSDCDSGPGFTYDHPHTWYPTDKAKNVTHMRPASVSYPERFAVHRMGHLSDRIWGPF